MKHALRSLLKLSSSRCWIRPPLIAKNYSVGIGLGAQDGERYHAQRREERRPLVSALHAMLPLTYCRVCSIGAGFGGEEWLMSQLGAKLEMIEPADVESGFLRKKFAGRAAVVHQRFYQFADLTAPCDLVYASSLGNWMNDDPLDGIRGDLLDFCSLVLAPLGVAVFLVFGGSHSAYVLDKAPFLRSLIASAGSRHFQVKLFALYKPEAALLVLHRDHIADTSALRLFASDVLIAEGQIVRSTPVRSGDYVAAAIPNLYTLAKNIRRSLVEFAASAIAIRRYR